jgi:glycosyltransferase involved in cell wall biosynthesis
VSISASKYVLRTLLKWRLHDLYIPNATAQFEVLQRYAKLPRSRMELIADGVDTDYFTPGGCDDAFAGTSLDRGRLWVMTASQARPEKRVDFVIEAARRVRSARPNLNIGFFHVGGGGCLATWRELASRVGLGSKYVFMEQKSDVLPYFRSASVFAHAAIRESFGLVIAEAMSCGLPVVATRSPGPQETIVDGHTGFVVEPDDLDGFVAALLTYIDNPELRKSHGTNGRERAVNLYSIQRQAREFADVLRRRFPDILG